MLTGMSVDCIRMLQLMLGRLSAVKTSLLAIESIRPIYGIRGRVARCLKVLS